MSSVSNCVHSETDRLTCSFSCLIMWFSQPLRGKGTNMPTVGYARVSSTGQDLAVQLEKLKAGCDKVFKEKRSGVDAGRPELKRCLEYLREGDTLVVTKIDRLALYNGALSHRIAACRKGRYLQGRGRPVDRHQLANRQAHHGHSCADCGVRERHPAGATNGRDHQGERARNTLRPQARPYRRRGLPRLESLRADGTTVPDIIRRVGLSKATVYGALNSSPSNLLAD